MACLLISDSASLDERWRAEVARRRPDLKIISPKQLSQDPSLASQITYALVWNPQEGFLASLPNLSLIISVGAGLDHLSSDPQLPRHVPTVRMVDPGLTLGMGEYVAWGCLTLQRQLIALLNRRAWDVVLAPLAQHHTVGVLGLGVLGQHAASVVQGLGFQVTGWSRTPKTGLSFPCYHGVEGLKQVQQQADILVLLLPHTAETNRIVDQAFLSACKRGVGLVNAGRGALIDDAALLAALESGQVGGAVLDVFTTEPLPQDHAYWQHERVFVTPHIASLTYPETGADHVTAAIGAIEAGQKPPHLVDWQRGY